MKTLQKFILVLSVFVLPCYALAQTQEKQNGLGVEITSSKGAKATLYVLASNPAPENLFAVISDFKFVPRIENNALRIEVLALLDGREQKVVSYLVGKGETVSVSEVRKFGGEPFEMRVVDASTMPALRINSPFKLDYNPNVYRRRSNGLDYNVNKF